jgi:hypothetical protein
MKQIQKREKIGMLNLDDSNITMKLSINIEHGSLDLWLDGELINPEKLVQTLLPYVHEGSIARILKKQGSSLISANSGKTLLVNFGDRLPLDRLYPPKTWLVEFQARIEVVHIAFLSDKIRSYQAESVEIKAYSLPD